MQQFFQHIVEGRAKVVGYSEFAYSDYGKLKGNDQLVEREYWIHVKGEPIHVILHVHYHGNWSSYQNQRDRTLITSLNLRHAVPRRNPQNVPVFPVFCKALRSWREKRKLIIPLGNQPWDWRNDGSRLPELRALLLQAERCARRVRSVDAAAAAAPPPAAGARHALILAVEEYAPPIPRLENPIQDGCSLRQMLLRHGWEVRARIYTGAHKHTYIYTYI